MLKTLHSYILRQIAGTLVMTVMVFTGVLLLGNVLREILNLMVNHDAGLGIVLKAIALLIPFVLVFALPIGMLTATLLVFGRLSADQELTAARANGISLVALVAPVVYFSVGMSVLAGWVNLELAPQCRVAYKRLLVEVGLRSPDALLTEGTFVTDIPGYLIYVGTKVDNELGDVLISTVQDDEIRQRIRASRGRLILEDEGRSAYLELEEAQIADKTDRGWQTYLAGSLTTEKFDLSHLLNQEEEKVKISNMSYGQLIDELRELEFQGADTTPVKVSLHQKVAFSFACIAFTLVGIPLGIRAHRRETTAGIAMALGLTILYYAFVILGQSLDTRADLFPHLIFWIPNMVFQAIGAVLILRAEHIG